VNLIVAIIGMAACVAYGFFSGWSVHREWIEHKARMAEIAARHEALREGDAS
jgi:hypothetical protein